MKRTLCIVIALAISTTSCSTLKSLIAEPTALETITALREVLNGSAFKAIRTLKQMQDGGLAALLPEELAPVLGTLGTLGLGAEVDKVTKTIGDASKIAVNEGEGIIRDAIKEVSFGDAVAVVLGGEDAATRVLKDAMYGAVKKRYSDRLGVELDNADVSQYWPMAAGAYNLFAKNKVDNSLPDFLAERAVDAVFLAMGKEEKAIRDKPSSLGSAVVTKVFDYYKTRQRS